MADITITEGNTLEVDYSVENTGDGAGNQDIRLDIQGALEDTDAGVLLDPGETATGTLQWPTETGDAVTDALAEALTDDTSDSITVTVESAIPDNGVSRYRFEDNGDTTTVTDVWGNNVGSINYNTSYSTSSHEGSYALSFTQEELTTSNDDPVSFGDVFDYGLSQSFSVVTWVNTTNSNPQYPLGKHDVQGGLRPGWNLDIGVRGSDGQATFEFQDSGGTVTATSSATVNDASYHLIGGVHDASTSTIYIYIDGTQEGSADVSGIGAITNNEPFVIGSSSMNNDSISYTYGGLQDDVRVYDKALSSTEMSNLNSTGSIDG